MQVAEAVHFSIFWFLKITKQIKFKFCFHLLLGLSLSNCSSEYTYILIYIYMQGHPTDLFLTISVLQRKFCWLGTEVSAVLLGSKVLNLRSRIYQMYQKFLLEVFYPSNLLEIFFVRELCARSRAQEGVIN